MGRIDASTRDNRPGVSEEIGHRDHFIVAARQQRAGASIATIAMAVLLLLFFACGPAGDHPPGDGSSGFESFSDFRSVADSEDCDCRVIRGLMVGFDECMAEISPSFDDTTSCVEQLAAENPAVQENLDCASNAELDLSECLSESSCAEDEYTACFADYHLAYADCPEITDEAFQELDDCF